MENKFLGVVEDPRTKEQKSKDWNSEEVSMAFPLIWEEKDSYKFFSTRNQNGSSSCMAQSGTKMLGVENYKETGMFKEFSATPVYQARANKPAGGMYQQDCLSLLAKPTACLEEQVPSQNMSESQMDASYEKTEEMRQIAEMYRANGYAFIPFDIDKVAQIVSQGKGVQLMVFFERDEWWNGTNEPKIINPNLKVYSDSASRHGICVTDFTLYNGEKSLIIEDSAILPKENGQRIITETFFKARCFGAGYLLELSNDHSVIEKPHHHFLGALKFGMRGLEVKALQDILKYEKFFPSTVPSTGYFGSITSRSLKQWQIDHAITDFAKETNMTKIRFGAKSLQLMNQLYT